MKLERYLTEYRSTKDEIMSREEDPRLDEVLVTLEKDCMKFIKETEGFLFRATNRRIGDLIKKNNARADRNPVDVPRKIHDMADKSFKKKFGWKVRSEGLFTATRESMTKGYGANMYLVFPIGDYKYVWSDKWFDFYLAQSDKRANIQDPKSQFRVDLEQHHIDELASDYTNKNLKKAFADRMAREIILSCPNGYYYVNSMMTGELSYYLGLERY
jgi:hypothetical protein